MDDLQPIRRALVSVSDKTGLVRFVKALREFDIEIISTGGTAKALSEAGIEVIGIEQITGFPEIMDGRIKTLHPAVHGALLGRRDLDSHIRAMSEHSITPIDLVCINLYPFEQTVAKPGVAESEAIEQIDIGGPAMLRSAAKNRRFVTVVTSERQYDRVIDELRANNGVTTLSLRRELAAAAFTRTAEYDAAISAWMADRPTDSFPTLLSLTYARRSELRYGENPHQKAVLYADPTSTEASVVTAGVLHGKPLSYNNINDAAGALELIEDLARSFPKKSAAAVIKHTNPCGAAVAETLADAFDLAYEGDSLAAYGGILIVSRPMDETTAESVCDGRKFFEVILAPSYEGRSLEMLSERWKNVRLLAVLNLGRGDRGGMSHRSIPGGMLLQERDTKLPDLGQWRHVAGPAPDAELFAHAAFIWIIVKHLTSNAVAISRGGQLIGAGAGQMDRVASCRIAVEKAGDRLTGRDPIIAASDAFFPFNDGPKVLIDAGVKCIVQPGGSKRDQDTLDLCNERGATCLLTGMRHFRH